MARRRESAGDQGWSEEDRELRGLVFDAPANHLRLTATAPASLPRERRRQIVGQIGA